MREAFRMEIGAAECRSVLLDWALSLPEGVDQRAAARALLERHASADHPMAGVLRAAIEAPGPAGRRGGRAGRLRRGGVPGP
jgi:hypothetical protein